MANTIVISGIIGIEVLADDVRSQLNQFNGQNVDVEINSPGGLIVDGIEMYNLFRMYTGRVTARIMGLAGSMASIIPMAADEIQVFDNSVFFIHLALSVIRGNKNVLRNEADILDGFDKMLINALSRKSGKSAEDLEAMMEKETFVFGQNIVDMGFADTIIGSDNPIEEGAAISNAKALFYACKERIKDIDPKLDKIAAYLEPMNFTTPERPALLNIQTEVNRMDKNKLKADYPDVYQAIATEAVNAREEVIKQTYIDQGRAEERKRLNEIDALSFPNDFASKAKNEGWSAEKTSYEFQKMSAENRRNIATNMQQDISKPLVSNAPEIPEIPKDGEEAAAKTPKEQWEASADLRAEFGNVFERYEAFLKAEAAGNVKIYKQGGK